MAWLKDWLSDRKQRVVVGGEASENKDVESSVIQGSVLGGILFIIFIDDIDDFILALIKNFADDTKIAGVVEDKSQAEELQRDIDKLVTWAKKWKMQFNVSKCKVLHFGRRNGRSKAGSRRGREGPQSLDSLLNEARKSVQKSGQKCKPSIGNDFQKLSLQDQRDDNSAIQDICLAEIGIFRCSMVTVDCERRRDAKDCPETHG